MRDLSFVSSADITEQEKEELIKEAIAWYKLKFVQYEIIGELKNRTFDLLSSKLESRNIATRYLYASSVQYLDRHFNELGIYRGRSLINLYRSIALFEDRAIPVSSYNLSVRRKEKEYLDFDVTYNKKMVGFDCIIDIDSKDIMQSYAVAKELKKVYDEYKLPYYIKHSGRRGFHIIIPSKYIDFSDIKYIKDVLYNLGGCYGLKEFVDLCVSNTKGLIKVAYSYDSGNISLPLDDYGFNNFEPMRVKCSYVLKSVPIFKRGLLIREHGLSEAELKNNVKRFISDFKA